MTAPDAIHELVAKFDQHQKEYQSHKNETELRREFLDPFFEALGWGTLTIEEAGKGALMITTPNWAEAEPGAGALQPSCFISSGLLADFFGRLSTVPVAVMEVECRSRSDAHCRFIAGTPRTMEAVFDALAAGGTYESALHS